MNDLAKPQDVCCNEIRGDYISLLSLSSKFSQTLFSLQLSSTKSMDGQLTLVHFLEDIIETKYPEISGFENELTHVEQAARGKQLSIRHAVSFR